MAQNNNISIGIKIGLNLSQLSEKYTINDEYGSGAKNFNPIDIENGFRPGYHDGVFFRIYNPYNNSDIQAEVVLSRKGGHNLLKYSYDEWMPSNDYPEGGYYLNRTNDDDYSVSFTTVDISILRGFHVMDFDYYMMRFFYGISTSFMIPDRLSHSYYKTYFLSLPVGISFDHTGISLDLRYELGLNNIIYKDYTSYDPFRIKKGKCNLLCLSVGYKF